MTTPTLAIHGGLDDGVLACQGLACYTTHQARGVDARRLWWPDQIRWILKPRNSRLRCSEFCGWSRRHDSACKRR